MLAQEWKDYLIRQPAAHFLQTWEWGDLKSQFGWEVQHIIVGTSGAQVLFRRLPLGFTVAYLGKARTEQIEISDAERFWAAVDGVCRQRRAIFCKIEPDAWMENDVGALIPPRGVPGEAELVRPARSVQPRRTITVDLEPTEDRILARMRQKCRYNIRLAARKGITVHAWRDIGAFHTMLMDTARRDRFAVHSASYYRRAYELFHGSEQCELLVAEFEGRPVAALMVFARGERAWYVYGGSTNLERERMPNHLLQWEAMLWARNRGCREYDLWGVPDHDESTLEADFESRRDGLWGVYRFKRGFGGQVRRAAPAVDRVYDPVPYRAYQLLTGRSET